MKMLKVAGILHLCVKRVRIFNSPVFWGLPVGRGLSLKEEIVSVVCNKQFKFFMLMLFQGPPHGPSWFSLTFWEELLNEGVFQQSLETFFC